MKNFINKTKNWFETYGETLGIGSVIAGVESFLGYAAWHATTPEGVESFQKIAELQSEYNGTINMIPSTPECSILGYSVLAVCWRLLVQLAYITT